VVPVGRLTAAQMKGLAAIAQELGDGDIRLTVWQNLLISGVPSESLQVAQERMSALGLATEANAIRSGLVACTGNTGCKFAAADTKRHAAEIAAWCETRVALDAPVNIHLNGCGFGPDAALGRELYRDVKAADAPRTIERILKAYLAHRTAPGESFLAFARRHETDALKALAEAA